MFLVIEHIRGLVAGTNEVQLGLLSESESIELLVKMSGIAADSTVDSPELMQIVAMCNRLPLMLCVAAGMMKSFGDDWKGNVLGTLQEDMNGSLAEAGAGLSPAGIKVNRSAQQLPDEDCIELFSLLAICEYEHCFLIVDCRE